MTDSSYNRKKPIYEIFNCLLDEKPDTLQKLKSELLSKRQKIKEEFEFEFAKNNILFIEKEEKLNLLLNLPNKLGKQLRNIKEMIRESNECLRELENEIKNKQHWLISLNTQLELLFEVNTFKKICYKINACVAEKNLSGLKTNLLRLKVLLKYLKNFKNFHSLVIMMVPRLENLFKNETLLIIKNFCSRIRTQRNEISQYALKLAKEDRLLGIEDLKNEFNIDVRAFRWIEYIIQNDKENSLIQLEHSLQMEEEEKILYNYYICFVSDEEKTFCSELGSKNITSKEFSYLFMQVVGFVVILYVVKSCGYMELSYAQPDYKDTWRRLEDVICDSLNTWSTNKEILEQNDILELITKLDTMNSYSSCLNMYKLDISKILSHLNICANKNITIAYNWFSMKIELLLKTKKNMICGISISELATIIGKPSLSYFVKILNEFKINDHEKFLKYYNENCAQDPGDKISDLPSISEKIFIPFSLIAINLFRNIFVFLEMSNRLLLQVFEIKRIDHEYIFKKFNDEQQKEELLTIHSKMKSSFTKFILAHHNKLTKMDFSINEMNLDSFFNELRDVYFINMCFKEISSESSYDFQESPISLVFKLFLNNETIFEKLIFKYYAKRLDVAAQELKKNLTGLVTVLGSKKEKPISFMTVFEKPFKEILERKYLINLEFFFVNELLLSLLDHLDTIILNSLLCVTKLTIPFLVHFFDFSKEFITNLDQNWIIKPFPIAKKNFFVEKQDVIYISSEQKIPTLITFPQFQRTERLFKLLDLSFTQNLTPSSFIESGFSISDIQNVLSIATTLSLTRLPNTPTSIFSISSVNIKTLIKLVTSLISTISEKE